ncbi:MAG: hypothetical protein ABI356_02425 [Steroidobacteraceae bacterium]
MKREGYIVLMLKTLSARGCLFLFVRTHHHLEYYFKVDDTRRAANETGVLACSCPRRLANVVEIHPISQPAAQRQ